MRQWKPGQIITIESKIYRITRCPVSQYCSDCEHMYTLESDEPCHTCMCDPRVPYDCYLREIKPKSVMG